MNIFKSYRTSPSIICLLETTKSVQNYDLNENSGDLTPVLFCTVIVSCIFLYNLHSWHWCECIHDPCVVTYGYMSEKGFLLHSHVCLLTRCKRTWVTEYCSAFAFETPTNINKAHHYVLQQWNSFALPSFLFLKIGNCTLSGQSDIIIHVSWTPQLYGECHYQPDHSTL